MALDEIAQTLYTNLVDEIEDGNPIKDVVIRTLTKLLAAIEEGAALPKPILEKD